MSEILKPLILIPELGEQGLLPDGGIINAGGVEGPNFTIGGKAVIFSDGTASDGSGTVIAIGEGVVGFEFVQTVPSVHWIIPHNRNSVRVQVSIWDTENEIVFSDIAKISDSNTVHIIFSTPQSGRAILMIF